MEKKVTGSGKKYRIAVACAQDMNTISAIFRAVKNGFVEALLFGKKEEIVSTCKSLNIDHSIFHIIDTNDGISAVESAVRMVKMNEADILMKGLVSTEIFLRAVMHQENGIMLPDAVLSYVGAIQIHSYHKILFITDPAVIPFPDLNQKVAMTGYAIEMARRFGIEKPKIALISASEKKMNKHFKSSVDYSAMCWMAEKGEIKDCIMDGPLDLFLACDRMSADIKGVKTPIDGDADVLLFPSLESANPFYKGLMLFAGGELAGLIRGTSKPVIVMSRSESENSKYYCIALSCLMSS